MKKNQRTYYSMFFYICVPLILLCGICSAQQLNPGDGIKVSFYNISDVISGEYFVEIDSSIQLPYLGKIDIRDKKFTTIQDEIFHKYSQLYKEPELSIQCILRINIFGEVKLPGYYYVTSYDKLSDLIAKAGGETSDANLDNIYIVRNDEKIMLDGEELMKKGNQLIDIGLESGDKIYISREWWVSVRNTSVVISAAAVIVALVSILKK